MYSPLSWFHLDNQKPVETKCDWLHGSSSLSPFSSLSLPCDGFFSETAKSKMLAPGVVQWALLMDMWPVAQCPEPISIITFQGMPTSTFASLPTASTRGGKELDYFVCKVLWPQYPYRVSALFTKQYRQIFLMFYSVVPNLVFVTSIQNTIPCSHQTAGTRVSRWWPPQVFGTG